MIWLIFRMRDYNHLIEHLRKLKTEQINKNTLDIDRLSPLKIVKKINEEDKTVAFAVEKQLPQIAKTAEVFAATLKNGGRVIYIGAGTSGRLGVLDAAECPPTFNTEPQQIVGVISGGYDTLVLSQEGVEDRQHEAIADLKRIELDKNDFVIGLAASRRTPYTLAGLTYAQKIGCKTAFIVCNKIDDSALADMKVDSLIELDVGPEVITGSTRMKSGTAQKMTLNMISTTAMILLGKTYGNLMIDLQANSEKLAARSRKILMDIFSISLEEAEKLINQAEGSVKTAIVMKQRSCDLKTARKKLQKANGFISQIS